MNQIPYYPQSPYELQMHSIMEDLLSTSNVELANTSFLHASPFLYDLSTIKHKLLQVESILVIDHNSPTTVVIADAANLLQEVVTDASALVVTLQQMLPNERPKIEQKTEEDVLDEAEEDSGPGEPLRDVIEIKAADLLAKYTHHCEVCGKGFKRDANLRMHMRAHGEEYKSSAALASPAKAAAAKAAPRRYSCPQEGCRWNRKHVKFQPLKSMVCVKNHYRRSHCPKLYVCTRCGRKQFSVLSDLRTHEKHCGDVKWRCSCGTTFSRKDKLMGHVALFAGHVPFAADQGAPEFRC